MADKKSILTLSLGSQRLGMARFASSGKGALQLNALSFVEIDGDPTGDMSRAPQIASAVKNLTTQFKAANQPVYYAISSQPVLSKFVKLPPLGMDKVDELIGFEAQQSIPWPISEVVWDHQVLSREGGVGEIEAVLVAMKADALAEINDLVENAPLRPELVDVAPLALYNAFRFNYPDATEPALIIDLGARTVNLLYVEGGGKFFFRTSQNLGGASITTAIAKEMSLEFGDAEQRKLADGYVALSGYADHEDPEIAQLSKVIRNALTRTHGDIVRTTNLYRTQQGGSAPEKIYLAGAAASMPYVKEFFEEKFSQPVEYFNALRNVSLGPKVSPEEAGRSAHTLGELVGLALRANLACPMEIDLVPPVVAMRRENARRRPFLFTAAACLFGVLLAAGLYHRAAAAALESRQAELTSKQSQLQREADRIAAEDTRASRELARAEYLQSAVQDRTYWVEVQKELNNLIAQSAKDLLWIVQLQPTVGDPPKAITDPLLGEPKSISFNDPLKNTPATPKKPGQAAGAEVALIDGVHIFGLYRDYQNDRGAEVVTDLFNEVKKNSKLFDIDPELSTDRYVKSDVPTGDQWAYGFEMRLPLKRKLNPTNLKAKSR